MTARTIEEVCLEHILDHPDQPRYNVRAVDELAASLEDVGQVEPIVVTRIADMAAAVRVISGHRRTAAARKLGWETISAIVLEANDHNRMAEVNAVMATNTARDQLTPLEEARGYQTMLDMGMAPGEIARATGRKAKYVEQAATLAGAFTEEHREELSAQPVSLEEYAALARHEENPERYKQLLGKVGTKDFAWTAQRVDEAAKRQEVAAAATAKLEAAGVPIVKHSYNGPQADLDDLLKGEKKLTAKTHAACPGHAARINEYATSLRDAIAYVCTDWAGNGHSHRYKSASGKTVDPYKEEQARDRAWKKRIKPTTEPRRDWLKALLAQPTVSSSSTTPAQFLLQTTLHGSFGALEVACDLLGVKVAAETDVTASPAWATTAKEELSKQEPMRAMLALACASGDEAVRLSKDPASRYWDKDKAVRYLRFLSGCGYHLSDVEREYVDAAEDGEAS